MASKKKSTTKGASMADQEARAKWLAEHVLWLGQLKDGAGRATLDQVEKALGFYGEGYVRNSICALLATKATHGGENAAASVRSFVAGFASDPLSRARFTPGRLRKSTIEAAISAWQRRPGERSGDGLDKWDATLALLRECGLAQSVTADAIRRGWNRRGK